MCPSAAAVPCEGQALALRAAPQASVVPEHPLRTRLCSGDHKLLILFILRILAIPLQTECMRGTGPRATGTEARFFRRAGAVTPIPTRCRFSCFRRDSY